MSIAQQTLVHPRTRHSFYSRSLRFRRLVAGGRSARDTAVVISVSSCHNDYCSAFVACRTELEMEKKTKGAWLLAQSKNLDAFSGAGAARLENVSYAGKVGRLYNLLRRNVADEPSPVVTKKTIDNACQLIGIDRPTREAGLRLLSSAGRIDIGTSGDISVLGATTQAVLEATADTFDELGPTAEEQAILDLSERVSEKPIARVEAEGFISDTHRLTSVQVKSLVDLSKSTALIDQEGQNDRCILFNSHTFRDGKYAQKAHTVLGSLSAGDQERLLEVQEQLRLSGALYDADVERLLGKDLYRRLVSVGLFDRMEVSNSSEAVGYISSPNDFQKFGRPFEEDPIDDAKALIASLTYGQTRSGLVRGQITMPDALIRKLIRGEEVGKRGVKAIGEDYKELEVRQVVKVTKRNADRYTMKLLKRDVGELALTIVRGGAAAQEAVLMDGSAATTFKGPHQVRTEVREKNSIADRRFVNETLDRLRSGG